MPIRTTIKRRFGVNSYSTFGATPDATSTPCFQEERTRSYSNTSEFRRAVDRARALRDKGYLRTTGYTDNLQQVINSPQMHLSGLLSSDTRSKFDWWFVPTINRRGVSTDDNAFIALEAKALEKLQSKVSGHGTNLPVTLAEAGETINMMATAAKRILSAYSHVRRGQFARAATALGLDRAPRKVSLREATTSNWMQYRYGWRTLAMDIESGMKTVYDILTTRPIIHRASVQPQGIDWWWSWINNGQNLQQQGTIVATFNKARKEIVHAEVTAGYVYQLESVPLSNAQALGLINLPTAAFELIPGSFMCDWFSNVSSVLEGLTAFQGKKFLDGWVTRAIESRTTEKWSFFTKGSGVYKLDYRPDYATPDIVERRFIRRPLVGFVHSSLRLEFDMNISKTCDLLSLVSQTFGRTR